MEEDSTELKDISESSNIPKAKMAFLDPDEVGPETKLYRVPQKRPTISDIRKSSAAIDDEQIITNLHVEEPTSNEKFHWFFGVFAPMIHNLVCVTFFIDLRRSIGIVGWGFGMLIFFLSLAMSYSTLISICVIATNGEMRDGGCYYLISRTLGPELGGAVGLTLILAHTTAIAFRLSYAAEVITNTYSPKVLMGSVRWDRTVWQIIINIIISATTLIGIKAVLGALSVLLLLLLIGVCLFFAGFFTRQKDSIPSFTSLSIDTLRKNFSRSKITFGDFIRATGFLFPSSNAVMTCANFSGNLNPPRRAIPVGGFIAMLISSVLLMAAFVLEAAAFDFDTESSKFVAIDTSAFPILTYIGFSAACVGSALTMHTGGARVITTMCQDGLLPKFFLKFSVNGEYILPHILQLTISIIFTLVDSPDTATIITNVVFLLPFGLINYAVWTAASAHYPGFRPSFKFFSKYAALFFAIICFIRMFVISWLVALATIAFFGIAYFGYRCMKIDDHWGTVTQSRTFYKTLKEELNLYHVQPHPKTFRPNILHVTTLHPDECHPAIDFLNQILHGFGMAAIGRVVVGSANFDFQRLVRERDGTYLATDEGYRTFYDVTTAETFLEGVEDLLIMMGIGMMRPNTLCMNFPEGWQTGSQIEASPEDIVQVYSNAADARINVMMVRQIEKFGTSSAKIHDADYMDVWWDDSNMSGMTLLLTHLLNSSPRMKKCRMRIITIADLSRGEDVDEKELIVARLLYKFRTHAEVLTLGYASAEDSVTPMTMAQWTALADATGLTEEERSGLYLKRVLLTVDLLRSYSMGSAAVLMTMPAQSEGMHTRTYMAILDILSSVPSPFCFIRGCGERTISWTV